MCLGVVNGFAYGVVCPRLLAFYLFLLRLRSRQNTPPFVVVFLFGLSSPCHSLGLSSCSNRRLRWAGN